MGTVTETVPPIEGGTRKTESQGGVKFVRLLGKHLMGATYATGGDTITMPAAPPGGTLFCVSILSAPACPVGIDLHWDGSLTTPKIIAHDEDDTSGVAAELANASAALVAQVVFLEFVYKVGA